MGSVQKKITFANQDQIDRLDVAAAIAYPQQHQRRSAFVRQAVEEKIALDAKIASVRGRKGKR